MNDAENLWNLSKAAKVQKDEEQKERAEREFQFAQTHLTWVIEKIMKPAAEKGHFSISDYNLPATQNTDAFKAACLARGFNVRNRGRDFTIIWAKDPVADV